MKYKIGEFSKMIGMEPSKIRYYEKKGVYRRARHTNGYRMFEIVDAYHMNYFRALCGRGYSIKEAIETLEGITLEQAIKDIEQKSKEVREEFLMVQQRKKYIEETEHLLKGVKENPHAIWLEEYPTYIVQPASKDGNYEFAQKNAKERYQWQERHPFLRYLGFGTTKSFLKNTHEYVDNGQGVREEDFLEMEFSEDSTLLRFKMNQCICFYAHLDNGESVNIEDFPHVQAYIREHNLQLKEHFLYFYLMMPITTLGNDIGVMCIPIK